jgi:hypothetical protein
MPRPSVYLDHELPDLTELLKSQVGLLSDQARVTSSTGFGPSEGIDKRGAPSDSKSGFGWKE